MMRASVLCREVFERCDTDDGRLRVIMTNEGNDYGGALPALNLRRQFRRFRIARPARADKEFYEKQTYRSPTYRARRRLRPE